MKRFLGHQHLLVRFISLYALGLILFFTSWTTSYYLLPEGLLSGMGILPTLAGDSAADTLASEFATIFLLNMAGFSLILIGNYVLRVGYFGFGGLVPLAWMVLYGVTLGTNSFGIPMAEPMAPSIAVFGRSGLYEMMAAVLLAVSTSTISANYSENFRSSSVPVPKSERKMDREHWIGAVIAILLLALAAMREAYMIVNL
ncbi:hypothetical protein [Methanosalsum zhilinae]|nr:hypothetical protein [Methanosalsum zhilinae]